jgi:hypothetical protein
MADTINIEKAGTEQPETWITFNDASDLLGISERHAWRVITSNNFKTEKKLNKDRKKTYVLRADIEQYYQAEKERQRLEQLQASPLSDKPDISDKPDKEPLLDKSDIALRPMSDIKNLPILMSDYRKMLADYQARQEALNKTVATWRTSTLWLVFIVLAGGLLSGYIFLDTKKAMSDRINDLSDRANKMSDIVLTMQKDIVSTKEEVFKRDLYIQKLEQNIPEGQLEKLKGQNDR